MAKLPPSEKGKLVLKIKQRVVAARLFHPETSTEYAPYYHAKSSLA